MNYFILDKRFSPGLIDDLNKTLWKEICNNYGKIIGSAIANSVCFIEDIRNTHYIMDSNGDVKYIGCRYNTEREFIRLTSKEIIRG